MKFEKPLISIIIPVYNAEKFLSEALDSCLLQTYRPIEIICVDNNSSDGSARILEEYQKQYPKIIFLSKEMQTGAPAARNKGVKESKGEYIYFLDADDVLIPKALRVLMKSMESGMDAICGGEDYYDSSFSGFPVFERIRIKNEDFHIGDVLYDSPNTGAVLLKKSILKNVLWDLEQQSEQEILFWSKLCLENNAKFKFVQEKVCKIRIHDSPGRISNQGRKKKAYNKYVAILKIESLFQNSFYRSNLGDIAFNDFKLAHAFNSINARNFKISKLTSSKVNKSLIPKSKNYRKISRESVMYHSNHYLGFLFYFICYKILGKHYSRIQK